MSAWFFPSVGQMVRVLLYFSLSRGIPCVDEYKAIRGIVHVLSARIVLEGRVLAVPASECPESERVMIDGAHLKPYRTAAACLKQLA